MMDREETLKERVVLATMEEMKLHALRFTMEDLTRRLHISKTSLYKAAGSKDQLIHMVVDYVIARLDEASAAINASDKSAYEKVCALIDAHTSWLGSIDERFLEEMAALYSDEVARWNKFCGEKVAEEVSLLEEGVRNGEFRPINPKLVQQSLMLLFNAATKADFLRKGEVGYTEAVRGIMDIFFNGIRLRKEGEGNAQAE